ncbi:MAG: hypothetical protein ACTSR8_21320 [Promethearchaeota archaeon]
MQTCKKIPPVYTTNYGKIIQMLIDGINYLSNKFLQASSYKQKEEIKRNIAILRHHLFNYTSSASTIDDQTYLTFKAFLDTILEV